MSTRGFVGYKLNKKAPKGWYNHSDSHPTELGRKVVEKACEHTPLELRNFFTSIKFDGKVNSYDNHKIVFDLNWNCRDFNSVSIWLEDAKDFYKDGLFCEYAYIFNFDNNTLEFYKGFGKPPTKGFESWYYEENEEGGQRYYVNRYKVVPLSHFHFDIDTFIESLVDISC